TGPGRGPRLGRGDPPRAGRAMSARLHLVRHGQTPSNVAGALDTALPGAPLTGLGREQARLVGEELAGSGIAPPVVLGAEAARARVPAGLVADEMALPTQPVPGLYEVQEGEFEMRTDSEAMLAYHRVVRDWLAEGGLDSCLPGGESALDVRERAMPVISELRAGHLDNGTVFVMVFHGTLMRMIVVSAEAVPSQWALVNSMPNCGVFELVPVGGGWSFSRWGYHPGPPVF